MSGLMARLGWSAAFLVVLITPLLVSTHAGRTGGLVLEVSLALGLIATSTLVGVIVIVSRVRSLTAGLGIEQILRVHRYLGLVVLILVLAHVGIVLLSDPHNLELLDLLSAPPRARAATLAVLALIGLSALATLRRRLGLSYQRWRGTHLALAAVAVAGSVAHIVLLRHLVSDAAMRNCFIALAVGLGAVLVRRWVIRPARNAGTRFVVRTVRTEPGRVITLVLTPFDRWHRKAEPNLNFAPGQFAWLRLRKWALCNDHPFTIASANNPDGTIEFTIRPGGEYTKLLSKLLPGRPVYLDGPHGHFSVDHTRATGLVLLASGVGITPMMSMLRTLADRDDPRPHRLLLSGRTPDDLLFTAELRSMQARLHLTVVHTLTRPPPTWQGETGRIDTSLLTKVLPGEFRRNQLDYFICGAAPFVEGVLSTLTEIGIPLRQIHTEQFDMV